MHITSVSVAVNYHGELAITLPRMRETCDESIVVTSPEDKRTQEIAKEHGATLYIYHRFKMNHATFNKSGAVLSGQRIAHARTNKGSILLVDADIVLPADLRLIVADAMPLDREAMYGMKRLDYHSPRDYAEDTPDGIYRHDHAGYFQFYQRRDILYKRWSQSAAHCDFNFRKQFRGNLKMFPGFCKHLGRKALNWDGRVAPEWS